MHTKSFLSRQLLCGRYLHPYSILGVGLAILAQDTCKQMITLSSMKESPYSWGPRQDTKEPYLPFVERLLADIEKQVFDAGLHDALVKQLARDNANADCQKIIDALPGDLSLDDMIQLLLLNMMSHEYIEFSWMDFGSVGDYRGGFCEKLQEASPMSDRANASWLQDGPTLGQGRANQE
ncbi:hypothetical protein BTVI_46489 [Pitangus sulphuratus]|nr:hypothetical protein BTVI_46489 [Pitangus sulphuratus]